MNDDRQVILGCEFIDRGVDFFIHIVMIVSGIEFDSGYLRGLQSSFNPVKLILSIFSIQRIRINAHALHEE
ncbi:hypothetical protein D3C74_457870 [compost metagenome]